jgi:choline transporter-like protein 2/4/5
VYRTFRYHLGSIAFGSLLVATIELVRFIAAYFQRKLKEAGQGGWTKWLCCCVQCWLGILEWIVNFINRNAYIMVRMRTCDLDKEHTSPDFLRLIVLWF